MLIKCNFVVYLAYVKMFRIRIGRRLNVPDPHLHSILLLRGA
jgi:hypothetical protein